MQLRANVFSSGKYVTEGGQRFKHGFFPAGLGASLERLNELP